MKKAILKYGIQKIPGLQEIEMPESSELLSFQTQNTSLQLWALIDPNIPLTKRKFLICFTGEEISINPGDFYKHIGTAQNGLVYHLFEKIN